MRALVLGAGGMLGQDVMRALDADDAVGLTHSELDITDAAAVRAAVVDAAPDVVFNCAAYTKVDGAESEPERAMLVNGEAAGIVAAAAPAVLYVSSDYVFDGRKGAPYVESDETGPVSSYGRSKLAGELATAEANPRHLIVRSSWLFGAGGRNFVDTMLRVGRERDEARVVADQVGCPTYTGHLAHGLLRVASGGSYGIHHVAAAGSCSWYELAAAAFERAGVDCRLEPITTDQYPLPAPRPAYSVLGTERQPLLPPWQDGLDAYLAEREVHA
ncbi:MAG TPA: dTDP-4-dehydrorhamnose reductase [Thermoleophilaceae bacterium]|nr:dTDP-4-dehydrorhamnose reductase [Thermoleophilaceae bacterium]